MKKQTLKQSLGNPARGDAFYPRNREIEKIFHALGSGANIYLSAPRRVGKTSILQHLEDLQDDNGYYFIYVVTESVDSINDFFKVLYQAMIESKSIRRLSVISKTITKFLEQAASRIDEIPGGLKLRQPDETDYHDMFTDLLSQVEKGIGRVVIMIDEFPQTLHNIHKLHGANEARKLLQMSKEIRQSKLAQGCVSFIYTGSISLFPMVEKIGSLADVNDLQPIEVKPLKREEAKDLLHRLCNRGGEAIAPEAVDYLLDKIRWYIPFHIQLIYEELKDISDGAMLQAHEVDTAITHTIDAKNKARFEPYFSRLKNLLEHNEYLFAMEVLMFIAKNDSADELFINDCSVKHNVGSKKEITGMLCEDGYLYNQEGMFIYTSPVLQMWCKKFNNDGI